MWLLSQRAPLSAAVPCAESPLVASARVQADLSAEQIVSLMSCLVASERNADTDDAKVTTAEMVAPVERLQVRRARERGRVKRPLVHRASARRTARRRQGSRSARDAQTPTCRPLVPSRALDLFRPQQALAKRIGTVKLECKMAIDVDEYVKSFSVQVRACTPRTRPARVHAAYVATMY